MTSLYNLVNFHIFWNNIIKLLFGKKDGVCCSFFVGVLVDGLTLPQFLLVLLYSFMDHYIVMTNFKSWSLCCNWNTNLRISTRTWTLYAPWSWPRKNNILNMYNDFRLSNFISLMRWNHLCSVWPWSMTRKNFIPTICCKWQRRSVATRVIF